MTENNAVMFKECEVNKFAAPCIILRREVRAVHGGILILAI